MKRGKDTREKDAGPKAKSSAKPVGNRRVGVTKTDLRREIAADAKTLRIALKELLQVLEVRVDGSLVELEEAVAPAK